jgi:hypothetical protein
MGFVKTAGVGLGVLFVIGACFGGDGEDTAPDKDAPSVTGSQAEAATDDPTEESDQDVWRLNHEDREKRIQKQLARRIPAYALPIDTTNEALATCDDIASGKPLAKRLKNAGVRWSANPDQAVVVLSVVADHVCPDIAKVHVEQVAAKRKADAAAVRRAAAAAAKKAERERRAAERRELLAQQQAQQQAQSLYYANCSAVEAAGAAPIYAGDPGYSRDLDRDGDGVACEQ